ncbi:hypothetical protein EfmAA96_01270 [Enterococcus faecium]|nr:hypothetical protein EfmAA96_01270 [Enterococcus faecium]
MAEQADSLDIASNQSLFFSDIGFYHLKGVLEQADVSQAIGSRSISRPIDLTKEELTQKHEDETIEWLNERFIESFENQFNLLREETSQLIRRELTKIHFKLLHYTINKADEFPLDVSFFRENYPAFYCYLIEQQLSGIVGAVAELIDVPADFTLAIEAALGGAHSTDF